MIWTDDLLIMNVLCFGILFSLKMIQSAVCCSNFLFLLKRIAEPDNQVVPLGPLLQWVYRHRQEAL